MRPKTHWPRAAPYAGVVLAEVADAVVAQVSAGLLSFVRFSYPAHIVGGKLLAECGDRSQVPHALIRRP